MHTTLRRSLRQKRRAISPANRKKFSHKLLAQCKKSGILRHSKKIALYLPNDGEIDTIDIQNFCIQHQIELYLPILSGKILKFAKLSLPLKVNKFGIYEPNITQLISLKKLNLILLPLVGFDARKNRIGMGGGFYDQTLAFKKHQKMMKNPKLYGLAFDCQHVEKINTQEWDVPLDLVITPSEIY